MRLFVTLILGRQCPLDFWETFFSPRPFFGCRDDKRREEERQREIKRLRDEAREARRIDLVHFLALLSLFVETRRTDQLGLNIRRRSLLISCPEERRCGSSRCGVGHARKVPYLLYVYSLLGGNAGGVQARYDASVQSASTSSYKWLRPDDPTVETASSVFLGGGLDRAGGETEIGGREWFESARVNVTLMQLVLFL
jgi:hypothetical protein